MSRNRFNAADHLNPGVLRHRVNFYKRLTGKNSSTGADENSYDEPFASNVPAAMNATGGKRFFDADRFATEILDTCMMRYLPGITGVMQAEFEGARFEIIETVDVDARHLVHVLLLRRLT